MGKHLKNDIELSVTSQSFCGLPVPYKRGMLESCQSLFCGAYSFAVCEKKRNGFQLLFFLFDSMDDSHSLRCEESLF